MKYFPFILHVVLATLAVGAAAGATAEHLRPLYTMALTGLAVGLCVTAIVRLLFISND